MAAKRKNSRKSSGGSRSSSRREGGAFPGRRLALTAGLGLVVVGGVVGVTHFATPVHDAGSSASRQRDASAPSVAARPAQPLTRYGSDDRDRLSRQIAAVSGVASRADTAREESAPAAPAAAAFAPPRDVPVRAAAARRMSSAEWRALDTAFADQLRRCWPQADARGQGYMPIIKVEFDANGALEGKPVLIGARNPQEIAAGEALAHAVASCGPIRVPADLRPFHAQWKTRTIRLDPPQMGAF